MKSFLGIRLGFVFSLSSLDKLASNLSLQEFATCKSKNFHCYYYYKAPCKLF